MEINLGVGNAQENAIADRFSSVVPDRGVAHCAVEARENAN